MAHVSALVCIYSTSVRSSQQVPGLATTIFSLRSWEAKTRGMLMETCDTKFSNAVFVDIHTHALKDVLCALKYAQCHDNVRRMPVCYVFVYRLLCVDSVC